MVEFLPWQQLPVVQISLKAPLVEPHLGHCSQCKHHCPCQRISSMQASGSSQTSQCSYASALLPTEVRKTACSGPCGHWAWQSCSPFIRGGSTVKLKFLFLLLARALSKTLGRAEHCFPSEDYYLFLFQLPLHHASPLPCFPLCQEAIVAVGILAVEQKGSRFINTLSLSLEGYG